MYIGKTDRAVFEACERDNLVKGMVIACVHVGCCLQLGSPEVMLKPKLSTGISNL